MQWLVVAQLARQEGADAVGAYALALAIAAPVFTFSMLQLRVLLVTAPDPTVVRGPFLAARVCTSLVALAVVLACAVGADATTSVVVVAVGLARCAETIGDLFLGCLQSQGRVDRVGRDQTLLAVTSTAAFGGALLATGAVGQAVWALPLCSVALALVLPWRQVQAGLRPGQRLVSRADLAPSSLREVVRTGLPLGGSSSVGALSVALPRFVLQGAHGSALLGVYSGVSQLAQAVTSLAGAVAQARLPQLAQRYHHGDGADGLVRTVLGAVAVCVVGGAVLTVPAYWWGPALVRALYGADFAVGGAFVSLTALTTGILSCGWFLDQALVTQRRQSTQLLANLAGLAIVGVGSLLLAPAHGLTGVAAAVTTGALVQCGAKLVAVVRAPRRPGRSLAVATVGRR